MNPKKISDFIIETERFKLAPFTSSDIDDIYITMNSPNTANIISFLKWPMTMEQAEQFFSLASDRFEKNEGVFFLARNKEDNFPIGCIGLLKHEDDPFTGEVGYWVTETCQGKGCAAEMLKGVINFAFKNFGMKKLIATAAYHNSKSIAVLQKQGFKIIGKKVLPTVKGYNLECHLLELMPT